MSTHQTTISEAELEAAMPPEDSFLHQYILHATKRCDSPVAYHYGIGLALIAAIAPKELYVDCLPGGKTPANLWVLCVGRTAVDRKTTAVRVGQSLLGEAVPRAIGDNPGSYEGLVESLSLENTQLAIFGEFGDFLAVAEGGYASKIKPFLTRIYDGDPYERRMVRKVVKIAHPRLSLLGAVNPPLLEAHAQRQDWEGGFLSRWLVLYAHRERDESMAEPDTERRDWLRDWLTHHNRATVGRCLGFEEDAAERWRTWNRALAARLERITAGSKIAAHGRATTQAIKICMLHAFDYGEARQHENWRIPLDILNRAIHMADLHYRGSVALAELAQNNRDMRDRAAVLRAVRADWTPYGELLREAQLLRARGDMVIETLLEEGVVTSRTRNGKFEYRLTVAGAALDAAELEGLPEDVRETLQAARAYVDGEP